MAVRRATSYHRRDFMPDTVNLVKSYGQEMTDEEEVVLFCSKVMMSNCPLDTHV